MNTRVNRPLAYAPRAPRRAHRDPSLARRTIPSTCSRAHVVTILRWYRSLSSAGRFATTAAASAAAAHASCVVPGGAVPRGMIPCRRAGRMSTSQVFRRCFFGGGDGDSDGGGDGGDGLGFEDAVAAAGSARGAPGASAGR